MLHKHDVSTQDQNNDKLKPDGDRHVWVALAAFRLDDMDVDLNACILDEKNLVRVDVGCFICETPLPKVADAHGPCPGEPS